MTDPTDPVESWLSADVELLAPPHGAFERVAHRARRRKAGRALGSVAAACVIIAGIAVLPQVASGLLPGHGGPNKVGTSSSSHPSTRPTDHRTPKATPAPTSSPRALRPGPSLSTAGSGPRPAARFEPTSVTFVGAAVGAVLGQVGACGRGASCTVAAGTPDYGGTWTSIGAPPAGPASGSSGVSQLRFLDADNGWAYGPALYATHDGGTTWTAIRGLPGRVIDLSTVNGRAFAVVASCTGGGAAYAAGCTSFALYSAASTSDHWLPVRGASASGPATPGGLQLTSQAGFLLAGRLLLTGPVDGSAWHRVRPIAGTPPCLRSAPSGASPGAGTGAGQGTAQLGPALLAPSGSELFLACATSSGGQPGSLRLFVSGDAGQTWQARGSFLPAGTPASLAAIPGGAIVLATTQAIYYSYDAASWHRARLSGGAPPGGFTFVGMTNTQQGVAVAADSGLHALFITSDGGSTWRRSAIG